MGSSNSGDHIAEDHIHTDLTSCNMEEPQHKYCPGNLTIVCLFILDCPFKDFLWRQSITLEKTFPLQF